MSSLWLTKFIIFLLWGDGEIITAFAFWIGLVSDAYVSIKKNAVQLLLFVLDPANTSEKRLA